MALNLKLESSQFKDPKQKRMLLVAAVFFVAAGILYWRLFFTAPAPPPGSAVVPLQGSGREAGAPVPERAGTSGPRATSIQVPKGVSEEALRRARLDTEVVKTALFRELRLYGSYPITIPAKGNPEPFKRKKSSTEAEAPEEEPTP